MIRRDGLGRCRTSASSATGSTVTRVDRSSHRPGLKPAGPVGDPSNAVELIVYNW